MTPLTTLKPISEVAIPMLPTPDRRSPKFGPATAMVGLAVLAAAPHLADPYFTSLGIPFMSYAIALLGFNLLFGYGGLLSFGHALFLAVGAYAAAVAAQRWNVTSMEGMLGCAVAAALCLAIPIAAIASRFTGIFFGMLTLSFGMLFYSFLNKFYILTGGDSGLPIPQPTLLGHDYQALGKMEFLTGPFYYYCLALLVVALAIMWRIVHSPYGLHLQASRDNEVKASYLGVRVRAVRGVAFVVSAVYGAVGGVTLGISTGLADPELAYWSHSGHLVFMSVLGGFEQFLGPVVGAFTFTLLQDQLQGATQYWRFFLGVMLVVLVIALPGGILGSVRALLGRGRSL